MNFCVTFLLVASLLVAKGALVSSYPNAEVDCDTMIVQLRELYRILMANGGVPGFHEMVRKAQRIPSLRLRFGKRSSPTWADPILSSEMGKED